MPQLAQTPPNERRQVMMVRQLERMRGEYTAEPTAMRLGEIKVAEGDIERERMKFGRLA